MKKRKSRYVTRDEFCWAILLVVMIWRDWSFWAMLAVTVAYGIYEGFKDDPEDES